MVALTSRTVPITSTFREFSQLSSVSGMARALTLLTTMSIPPIASAVLATQVSSASLSPTSTEVPVTWESPPDRDVVC